MQYTGWPEQGELIVGEVDEIADFGVFVDLTEYRDRRGLVHISEVASGWIKNVRDHVREGQTIVAKVLSVDEDAQQIDLSLKDVNEHQRKETIQEWKNEQKADNWMTIAFGEDLDDERYEAVAVSLLEEFPSLYAAFEAAAIEGAEALDRVELDAEALQRITETARENVSVPYVSISGYVDLTAPGGEGVDTVKTALQAAEDTSAVDEEVDLAVTYVGAPEYRIRVRAPDYKTAETQLEAAAARAETAIQTDGGTAMYHRERADDEE